MEGQESISQGKINEKGLATTLIDLTTFLELEIKTRQFWNTTPVRSDRFVWKGRFEVCV